MSERDAGSFDHSSSGKWSYFSINVFENTNLTVRIRNKTEFCRTNVSYVIKLSAQPITSNILCCTSRFMSYIFSGFSEYLCILGKSIKYIYLLLTNYPIKSTCFTNVLEILPHPKKLS